MSIPRVPIYVFGIYQHHRRLLHSWFPSVKSLLAYRSFKRPVPCKTHWPDFCWFGLISRAYSTSCTVRSCLLCFPRKAFGTRAHPPSAVVRNSSASGFPKSVHGFVTGMVPSIFAEKWLFQHHLLNKEFCPKKSSPQVQIEHQISLLFQAIWVICAAPAFVGCLSTHVKIFSAHHAFNESFALILRSLVVTASDVRTAYFGQL